MGIYNLRTDLAKDLVEFIKKWILDYNKLPDQWMMDAFIAGWL